MYAVTLLSTPVALFSTYVCLHLNAVAKDAVYINCISKNLCQIKVGNPKGPHLITQLEYETRWHICAIPNIKSGGF